MLEPDPTSVRGDFGDVRFEHKGVTSRFYREGAEYFVDTDGADGKIARFKIRYVVGKEPLQQYLVELDGGRLQVLDIAWDTERKRWLHLYPDQDVSAGNGLHWTGNYKNWQARCAVCHQTDFRKNYRPETRTYQSAWAELTVGCEACHGPGQAHVAWAQKGGWADLGAWPDLTASGFPRAQSTSKQAIEQDMCGPCHARRDHLTPDSTPPGAHFSDFYSISGLGGGLYFPDGQQDQEVYILGSFLQSKMHQKGVTCSNCHEPHSAGLVAEGNAVCTQCHNETGREGFPSLVLKDYDSPDHHHHQPGAAGSQCVGCHMPERTYMTVDARRDHFFRVPDPELSRQVGSPDACLSCHAGQTDAWAAASVASWAPERKPADRSVAILLSEIAGSGLSAERMSALVAIARDPVKPAFSRRLMGAGEETCRSQCRDPAQRNRRQRIERRTHERIGRHRTRPGQAGDCPDERNPGDGRPGRPHHRGVACRPPFGHKRRGEGRLGPVVANEPAGRARRPAAPTAR
ncbi:cytochrome c3 family protein [Mesorhizobium sp. ZMM04-4]